MQVRAEGSWIQTGGTDQRLSATSQSTSFWLRWHLSFDSVSLCRLHDAVSTSFADEDLLNAAWREFIWGPVSQLPATEHHRTQKIRPVRIYCFLICIFTSFVCMFFLLSLHKTAHRIVIYTPQSMQISSCIWLQATASKASAENLFEALMLSFDSPLLHFASMSSNTPSTWNKSAILIDTRLLPVHLHSPLLSSRGSFIHFSMNLEFIPIMRVPRFPCQTCPLMLNKLK